MNSEVRKGPLQLFIGITGHRDLRTEDIPNLEKAIRQVFEGLARDYPHTPVFLLSPLAEGADRLAARVALEMGVSLAVPMPMPQEEYEKDFVAEGSLGAGEFPGTGPSVPGGARPSV
jgi:hypothetical protein